MLPVVAESVRSVPPGSRTSTLTDAPESGTPPIVTLVVITAFNGVAEELFFRGAVYAAFGPRWDLVGSTALYTASTLFSGVPLLTFAVRGRCLLIGGPGRGKTASAALMGVLAGYPPRDVRRHMQHGHPQLTVADLFGTPLPRDLVHAERLSDIDVAWRSWLGMRVKIVDEYNRIPTRTQSALLTVLADGYVEAFDQIYEVGRSAWYLTANDDAGGGTYQVIEALRDRIDVVGQDLQPGRIDTSGPDAGTLLDFDPATPGDLPVVSSDYTGDPVPIDGFENPVEFVGHVVEPALDEGSGNRPLVLFLHGRHEYCYTTCLLYTSDAADEEDV